MNANGQERSEIVSRYIIICYCFCILGWFYEVILAFMYGHGFVNRGFLFGPYLPLYGFGTLLLMLTLSALVNRRIKIKGLVVTPLVVFISTILLTTTLEYMVGLLLELTTRQKFWDYSTYPYQLHGRICLSASLRFGIGGMIILYILIPIIEKRMSGMSGRRKSIVAAIIAVVLLIDFILTVIVASNVGFNPVLARPR